MFTWTETPLLQIWHHLRYLQSTSNVASLLSGKITSNREPIFSGSNDIPRRSHEIASCIRQADEYYKAAENVGLSTHPLLQFYGATSLAKAVILFNMPSISLLDLKYHGLHTRHKKVKDPALHQSIESYTENALMWNIEDEFAIMNDGVFPNLCESIGDVKPEKGVIIKFKEIIRILPDLSGLFRRHYGEPSHCFRTYTLPPLRKDNSGKFEVIFDSREDKQNILKVFPELESDFEEFENNHRTGFRSRKELEKFPDFGIIEEGTLAGNYLVRPIPCGIHKSFSVIFLGLFILSTVVRYKPSFWVQAIAGENSGSVSIVETFCNLAKRRLPNDALESIWEEKFEYGTPARLA